MFSVLVCGGRIYSDRAKVFAVLDEVHAEHPHMRVIEGGCRGADALAASWALTQSFDPLSPNQVDYTRCDADWKKHGKAAGPLRNQMMLGMKPDLVIAFGGGKGTADMLKRARKAGVAIREVDRP